MDTGHLSISYHIPNEFTNRKQNSCFPSRGQYTDDIMEAWAGCL